MANSLVTTMGFADVVGQKRRVSTLSTSYRMRTGMHLCLSLLLWCLLFSLGQELRALWADKVDALGQRRHDAVGLSVGTRDAVSFTIRVHNSSHHIQ